jgi:hypothetical protein
MKIGEVAKIKSNGKEISMLNNFGVNKGLMKLNFGLFQILILMGLNFTDAFSMVYREEVTFHDVV